MLLQVLPLPLKLEEVEGEVDKLELPTPFDYMKKGYYNKISNILKYQLKQHDTIG